MFAIRLKTVAVLALLVWAAAAGIWGTEGSAAQLPAEPGQPSVPGARPGVPPGAAKVGARADGPTELKADKIIPMPDEHVLGATITPDGKFVIAVTSVAENTISETKVKVWDSKSGALKATLLEGGGNFYTLALSPSGKELLVGTGHGDHDTQLYDVSDLTKEPKLLRALSGAAGAESVAFSPDGKMLLIGNGDGVVQAFGAQSGELVWSKEAHGEEKDVADTRMKRVRSVAFSPDGKLVVSAGADATVQIRAASDGSVKTTFKDHSKRVNAVRFSPDGKLVASGGHDMTVCIWTAADGKLVHKIHPTDKEHCRVDSLAFSPDGKLLAICGSTFLGLWDVQGGKKVQTLTGHESFCTAVAFTKDGTTLMAGGWKGGVGLWKLQPAPEKK